ncbi:MAG: hypothetical protein QNL62_15690 [Gammaproteobacteria bacterium]|nr:hypothetical protein [Gammaproteobacteria bacterium]
MAKKNNDERVTFKVSIEANKKFEGRTAGFVFDASGDLIEQQEIIKGQLNLSIPAAKLNRYRLFISPLPDDMNQQAPSIKTMERLNAYEPLVSFKDQLIDTILIPGHVIEFWNFCLCWVRGQVIKDDSNGPVCGAKVHICEVDKIWRWIIRLPDLEIFKLRDDLIRVIEEPHIRFPPRPQPDPSPIDLIGNTRLTRSFSSLFARDTLSLVNPQPEPSTINNLSLKNSLNLINPQPEPPGVNSLPIQQQSLPVETLVSLKSDSAHLVRETLVANLQLILPYLCLWPIWWRFRCDEIAVVETNALGRFQAIISYQCSGDKPDLYFWVEYEIDGSLETIHHPPIPCNTYWNYACGTEVIIRIKDDRVLECGAGKDLNGLHVWVETIGNNQSVGDIHHPGTPNAGLTPDGRPFGGQLEPRVSFSRSNLIAAGITHYLWSVRPDGAPDSEWKPMADDVVRHYKHPSGSVPVYPLGPENAGNNLGRFQIQPILPPVGAVDDWVVWNQHVDLASAYLRTSTPDKDPSASCGVADPAADKYELKLELFKSNGNLVDWTAEGITPQITEPGPVDPFGDIDRITAPNEFLIKSAGHIMAFKMVLHIDNSRCGGAILPVDNGSGLTKEECGFIQYVGAAQALISFQAGHPNNFARVTYRVDRGEKGCRVVEASVSGQHLGPVNLASEGAGSFQKTSPCDYQRLLSVNTLLTSVKPSEAATCSPCLERAAFAEVLWVRATATNGYSRLDYLDAFDTAAFALTKPCPPCPDE